MLDWLKLRRPAAHPHGAADLDTEAPRARAMSGKYLLLYKYLENRYATTVVLTFAEIEDLLGFTLPDQARHQQEWWTKVATTVHHPDYSDSWILASRTAVPNLLAQSVVFERVS